MTRSVLFLLFHINLPTQTATAPLTKYWHWRLFPYTRKKKTKPYTSEFLERLIRVQRVNQIDKLSHLVREHESVSGILDVKSLSGILLSQWICSVSSPSVSYMLLVSENKCEALQQQPDYMNDSDSESFT